MLSYVTLPQTEHSKNKIIALFGLFENELGHGVFQLTVQKICIYAARKPKGKGVGH